MMREKASKHAHSSVQENADLQERTTLFVEVFTLLSHHLLPVTLARQWIDTTDGQTVE